MMPTFPDFCADSSTAAKCSGIFAWVSKLSTVLNSAAKAGLAGLTRALAIELAPEARVNGVSPGPIDWPEDEQFSAEERQQIIDHTLLKRIGSAADIARTVRFLMFDAPYITGQIIAVDGGRSAHL